MKIDREKIKIIIDKIIYNKFFKGEDREENIMNNEKINIENTEKIISLIPTLENMKLNEKEIVKWTKEDIKQICEIQKQLNKIELLKYAYRKKERIDIENLEEYIEKKEILKIYNIINKELSNWRDINICIQACYAQIK